MDGGGIIVITVFHGGHLISPMDGTGRPRLQSTINNPPLIRLEAIHPKGIVVISSLQCNIITIFQAIANGKVVKFNS